MEADATKTTLRRNAKSNTHCGRFIIAISRETGLYALTPLADKDVAKKTPPPPETAAEVEWALGKQIKSNHILSTDAAVNYKKFMKGKGPHVYCIHKYKKFSAVVRIPLKKLSPALRKRAVLAPTTTSRNMRLKSGDQAAEWTFSVIKRNLGRLNLKGSTARAKINFLAAAWLQKNPGLRGACEALRVYREGVFGEMDPSKAFTCEKWLVAQEPVK